ncbi:MAG: efflux RND transporter permease subunit [Pseudomonadota bacterium]
MTAFFGYFTRHRTIANLIMVLMIALGVVAMSNIRSQFFPDVVAGEIDVAVVWDGAGAEDIDLGIVAILEPALQAVDGVMSTSARSREGRAFIEVEFEPDWDMTRAEDDIEAAIDGVNNLPDDAEDPSIQRSNWADRVTDVIISGPGSVDQLSLVADDFVNRLFQEGITRTTIRGVANPEIEVEVSQADLMANDLTMQAIAAAINAEVTVDPLGEISGIGSRIRGGVARQTAADVADIVLRSHEDGSKLRIGDIAAVTELGAGRERTYYVGDQFAVSVRVDRSPQGDAIDIQRGVERVAAEMNAELGGETTVELIRTRSEVILDRLNILYENGLMGLGLVILLLFLFLNARTAFWVAAGIPVAMFAAVALMYASGITINMISLFGMIICLGIVVDDAIVVGEHADYRARVLGEAPQEAAANAATRMSMPVFTATITTVLAFYGLTQVGGRFGELILDIPYTVIMVLLASLIECFIILPHHMAHSISTGGKTRWYDRPSEWFNRHFVTFREAVFRPFVEWCITLRYPFFAASVLVLVLSSNLFFSGKVPFRFINFPEQDSISANFLMLPGATRDDSVAFAQELQRAAKKVAADIEAETGVNPVDFVMAEVGGQTGRALPGSDLKDADLKGALAIELIAADDRPDTPSRAYIQAIQDEINQSPLVETLSFRTFRFGGGDSNLSIDLFGGSLELLKTASEDLKATLAEFPEISGIEDNLTFDQEEIILELTPAGEALGFTVDELNRELSARLSGIEAATFPDGQRSAEIHVRLPAEEVRADFLDTLRLRSPSGEYMPLGDLVTATRDIGFATITRENGLVVLTVTAELSEDSPDRAAEVTDLIRSDVLPALAAEHGISHRLSGQAEEEARFLNEAFMGFLLCLLGIFLTLAWVFQSWTRPIVVMAIIPFGFIGAIIGHHVFDVPLSMFSIIGLIGMTGIIINDSIVLITTIDEFSENRSLKHALIDAVCNRFRPVLLTTLTTVLGLVPLLFEKSQQAQFLKPTIITLSFGLAVGMFIILLIVPALVMVQRDVGSVLRSARRLMNSSHSPEVVQKWMTRIMLLGFAWMGVVMGALALSVLPSLAIALLVFVMGLAALLGGTAMMIAKSPSLMSSR